VTGNFWVVALDGSISLKHASAPSFEALLKPEAENWGLWATAAWRDTWAKYGLHAEQFPANEDLELWLRWLRDGAVFEHVDVPVHIYMLRLGSVIFHPRSAEIGDELRARYAVGAGSPRMGLQTAMDA
jgi:hypothetical protein